MKETEEITEASASDAASESSEEDDDMAVEVSLEEQVLDKVEQLFGERERARERMSNALIDMAVDFVGFCACFLMYSLFVGAHTIVRLSLSHLTLTVQ